MIRYNPLVFFPAPGLYIIGNSKYPAIDYQSGVFCRAGGGIWPKSHGAADAVFFLRLSSLGSGQLGIPFSSKQPPTG